MHWVIDADGDSDPRSLCDGPTDQWLRGAAVLQKLPDLPGIGTATSTPERKFDDVFSRGNFDGVCGG